MLNPHQYNTFINPPSACSLRAHLLQKESKPKTALVASIRYTQTPHHRHPVTRSKHSPHSLSSFLFCREDKPRAATILPITPPCTPISTSPSPSLLPARSSHCREPPNPPITSTFAPPYTTFLHLLRCCSTQPEPRNNHGNLLPPPCCPHVKQPLSLLFCRETQTQAPPHHPVNHTSLPPPPIHPPRVSAARSRTHIPTVNYRSSPPSNHHPNTTLHHLHVATTSTIFSVARPNSPWFLPLRNKHPATTTTFTLLLRHKLATHHPPRVSYCRAQSEQETAPWGLQLVDQHKLHPSLLLARRNHH